MPNPGKLSSPELQQRIANQYLAGVGVTEIAKEVGVAYSSLRELLLRKGLLRHAADFPLSRFEASFIVTPGCWLWIAEIGISGYGRFWAKQRKHRAHRYSYQTYKGEIPKGMHVLHSCDNPRCVNPDHLRIGTDFDNTQDKISRRRFNSPKGEASNLSKLKKCEVIQIRSDTRPLREIASDYGVSDTAISRIQKRQTWAHF